MVASISGGAEKLKAMNGTVVKALKPPIEEKALWKSLPLIYSKMLWDNKPVLIPQKTNHLWIQWASSIETSAFQGDRQC